MATESFGLWRCLMIACFNTLFSLLWRSLLTCVCYTWAWTFRVSRVGSILKFWTWFVSFQYLWASLLWILNSVLWEQILHRLMICTLFAASYFWQQRNLLLADLWSKKLFLLQSSFINEIRFTTERHNAILWTNWASLLARNYTASFWWESLLGLFWALQMIPHKP